MASVQKIERANSLEYVRSERNLSLEAVANVLNTSARQLKRFEQGEAAPSIRQYALLEKFYGVPDYILSGTERPNLKPVLLDYRKEHLAPLEISPRGLAAYFHRLDTANTIAMLAGNLISKPDLSIDLPLKLGDAFQLIEKISASIGFSPSDPGTFLNPELAFRRLRHGVERYGSFCFLVEVPQVDYRGLFSSTDNKWGMCLVNKRTFKTKARMFTVAHEFAHFLTHQEGASDPFITMNDIEKRCNIFASEFLAPREYFNELTRSAFERYINLGDQISFISSRSLLSKGATAFRLFIQNAIRGKDYREWLVANQMPRDYGAEDTPEDLAEPGGGGGHWAYNVVSDLGLTPIMLVQEALTAGLIDDVDAGRLLNARGETLQMVFDTAERRLAEITP